MDFSTYTQYIEGHNTMTSPHTMSAQVSVRLDDDMRERLEAFRDDQVIAPNKSEVVRTAPDRFLEEEGY